jgi:predicted RNA-binding protein associated with RNAse of E/G family
MAEIAPYRLSRANILALNVDHLEGVLTFMGNVHSLLDNDEIVDAIMYDNFYEDEGVVGLRMLNSAHITYFKLASFRQMLQTWKTGAMARHPISNENLYHADHSAASEIGLYIVSRRKKRPKVAIPEGAEVITIEGGRTRKNKRKKRF